VLGPKSGRTLIAPRPSRLLSKRRLRDAWDDSRDASVKAGRAGIDGVTAQSFAANLDANLSRISRDLSRGAYRPNSLKAVFIPKENSIKERMICIPCVADRVVQRAIVHYLASNRKLPIYNESSFGFIDGLGTSAAILRSIELKNQYEWCLKADIESFFDSIPRQYLKARLSRALRSHSLVPVISRIIDCEIKPNSRDRERKCRSMML
jgi:RNA-directed DNA polymerase